MTMWSTLYLQGKQLPSTLNMTPYFHIYIPFQNLSFHYVVGHQVVNILSAAMLGMGHWEEHCNLTMLGFLVLSKRTAG